LTVLNFDGNAQSEVVAPKYLDIAAVEGGDVLPSAGEIYIMLANYVEQAGCTEFVAPSLLEDFAFLRRSFLECEYMNKKHGRIAKGKRSPYVQMSIDYAKAAQQFYAQIWSIVSQNSTTKYDGKNEFLHFLQNRGF